MNTQLQNFARQTLKDGLSQLPENQQMMFKRLHSHRNLNVNINDVVAKMPEDRLDSAMQLVERSLKKFEGS